jgi:hypothetical protein
LANEPRFRVRCNQAAEVTQRESGTALFLVSPPDMDYTCDGLHLCGITSEVLRDRGATRRFADGVQDGNQPRLPNDIWIPTSEVEIFMSMPPMQPAVRGQFGDFLR